MDWKWSTISSIGTLPSDNGKKHTSNEFESCLCQHGIMHQTIILYSPQHNGVVEWMNGTFLNMVHSMLFFKNVKLMFWGDLVLFVVYLCNLTKIVSCYLFLWYLAVNVVSLFMS